MILVRVGSWRGISCQGHPGIQWCWSDRDLPACLQASHPPEHWGGDQETEGTCGKPRPRHGKFTTRPLVTVTLWSISQCKQVTDFEPWPHSKRNPYLILLMMHPLETIPLLSFSGAVWILNCNPGPKTITNVMVTTHCASVASVGRQLQLGPRLVPAIRTSFLQSLVYTLRPPHNSPPPYL